jgi:C-terminal processing protease CtpA/Prc
MPTRPRQLLLTALIAALLAILLAAAPGAERTSFAETQPILQKNPGTSATRQAASEANVKLFDEVWSRVREDFYDPKFGGLDWQAVADRYRPQIKAPGADPALVINRMLAELGASHTGYYTPADTAYYDLADIFAGGLRGDLPKHFAGGEVTYTGIGMLTRVIEGRRFITGILAGFVAETAGLAVGDELLAADGAPFTPVASFAGKAGKKVTLTIRRNAAAKPQDVVVTPQSLHPNKAYRDAMESGARIIETGGRRIGYVHIWSYARHEYQELLEDLLTRGKLKDADALIWDLRDGWGGADPAYLDIFNPRGPTMIWTGRKGDRDIINGRWRRPVVLLINEGTRSGKEVLAYGFKKYGFGKVVGTKSAGAVLAGRAFMLSKGGLLLLAVADVSVDGERLEGKGVTPLIEVPFDIRYADGNDPQLARAVDLLAKPVSD